MIDLPPPTTGLIGRADGMFAPSLLFRFYGKPCRPRRRWQRSYVFAAPAIRIAGMDRPLQAGTAELATKIARLVEERGWNQEAFARIASLNRQTVRQILLPGSGRRLRNATIGACARALGLTVSDLRDLPLERLLPRMRDGQPGDGDDGRRRLAAQASHPELVAWLERHPDRAARLSADDWGELLALQESGEPLTALGVEGFAR